MKAAMILAISLMLGFTSSMVNAAETHQHGQVATDAKSKKLQSLGGGKTCDKCKKNKGEGMSGGMNGCCCAGMKGKMGMMSEAHGDELERATMMERMQNMEARMGMMQKMMEQMGKAQVTPAQ